MGVSLSNLWHGCVCINKSCDRKNPIVIPSAEKKMSNAITKNKMTRQTKSQAFEHELAQNLSHMQ
jgi:hypothetical protein